MRALLAAWRLARAAVHALSGWLTIRLVFPRLSMPQREARVQAWAQRMLALLGIRVEVHGHPPAQGPLLLVSNHISWLDIVVIHAARHCRFVSKSELARWPLVGTLATGAGTLYIERASSRDAMRVVHRMAASLREGDILAVFPEGTTSDGRGLLPFHANLLQAAVSADAPIMPMSLDFVETHGRQRSLRPSYIDDDTLVGSIWRTLAGPPITAIVSYGQPQQAEGRGRRQWASDLREAVARLRER